MYLARVIYLLHCIVLKSYPIYTLHYSATLTVTIVGFPRDKPVVLGLCWQEGCWHYLEQGVSHV
jgi:hypothetical protein